MKCVWVMLRNCLSLNKGDKLYVTSRKLTAMPVFKHVIIRNILRTFDYRFILNDITNISYFL